MMKEPSEYKNVALKYIGPSPGISDDMIVNIGGQDNS